MANCFCSFCTAALTGGIDTFGDRHEPLCVTCYHELHDACREDRADGTRLRAEEKHARAELARLHNAHRNVKKRWRLSPTPRNRARLRRLNRQMRTAVEREEGLYWVVRMRPPSYHRLLAKIPGIPRAVLLQEVIR